MPDGGFVEFFAEVFTYIGEAWEAYGTYVEVAVIAAAAYQSYESAQAARAAYNASLRNRYVMQRTSTGQRQLVLGRCRVSGPIAFMGSYGTNNATLAIVVVLAAHECDAIETIYFNDEPIILDSGGNVSGTIKTENYSVSSSAALNIFLAEAAIPATVTAIAQYPDAAVSLGVTVASDGLHCTLTGARAVGIASVKVQYQPVQCVYLPNQLYDSNYVTTAAASSGSYSFPSGSGFFVTNPDSRIASNVMGGQVSATSVVTTQTIGGVQTALSQTVTADSAGHAISVAWTGATVGASITVAFQSTYVSSRARVRQYLGAPGQTADFGLESNLPGIWDVNHTGTGLCYLVVEMDYDQSSYSTGIPNVSATIRGAKIFDPRTSTTAWSDNPALMTRAYWTHVLGAGQSSSNVDDTSIIAAANTCDTVVTYPSGPYAYQRAQYKAGIAITKDVAPQDALTQITQAMGGRWVISANSLRVRAGAYVSPVASIDNSWLTSESAITVQPLPPRQSLFNSVQGTFADETNEYRAVAYPKQISSALVTSDGHELPLDITYAAVNFAPQAQYLSAVAIRYNRAAMSVKLTCNMRAMPLEVFDVVALTLPRFGFVNQVFEVTDTSFTPEGLVSLNLKFIDPSIWTMDSGYNLPAYSPRTLLPSPFAVGTPTLGTPLSGAAQLLKQTDGTIVSRIYVPFTVSDVSVLSVGFVDVSYADATDTGSNWNNVTVSGNSTGTYLSPVKDGHTYLIKVRARNTLASSPWSPTISCIAHGLSSAPTDPSGLAAVNQPAGTLLSWTPSPDADYSYTAVRVGASGGTWATATPVFQGAAASTIWAATTAATYVMYVTHYNTSGIASNNISLSFAATLPTLSSVRLIASSSVFKYTIAGGSTPTPTSVTITAVGTNVTGSPTFNCTGGTLSVSGAVATLSYSTTTQDVVTVGVTWGGLSDQLTVTRVHDGANGTNGTNGSNGSNGSDGADGKQYATPTVYQWASSIPSGPSGAATYTWSTGAFGSAPTGWSLTPGTSPSAGFTLWGASVPLVATAAVVTTSFNWTSASIVALGYAGSNGSPGSTGTAGASARYCYQRCPGNPAPVSGNITTTGNTSFPTATQSNTTWGINLAWVASDPNTSSTDTLYQADGIYDPSTGNTVWTTPYISSLKVGSLSAISANLGTVTAGTFTGGTIIGGLIETATSGQRVVLNESSTNTARLYATGGAGLELIAQIGPSTFSGANTIAFFGSITSGNSSTGVAGASNSGYGVLGTSVSGTGVQAGSSTGSALFANTSSGSNPAAQLQHNGSGNALFATTNGSQVAHFDNGGISLTMSATDAPCGAITVNRPAVSSKYAYFGMNRGGAAAWGIGMDASNNLIFGPVSSGGYAGIISSVYGVTTAGDMEITASFKADGGFGCNGTNPQLAYPSGGTATGTLTDVQRLVNNIRAALVANGIMS